MDKRDYYEVMGLPRGATDAEIKRAYRRLAKQFHPDQNRGNKDAEARFKEIQEAYSVLQDPEKRRRYDSFGHAGVDPRYAGGPGWPGQDGGTVDFGDFADIFDFGRGVGGPAELFERFFGGRSGAKGRAPAADVEHTVQLTFDQAIHGTTLEIDRAAGRRREQISVRIPPGVREGQRIRVRGKGQPGSGGRPAGDLHVICSIAPHPWFRRVDDDIHLDVPVTLSEAALGARVDIPTLDGVTTVTIPPGTPGGARLRLAGLGAPNPRNGRRGDQYALIRIVPPALPTARQRRLLEELRDAEQGSPRDGIWK
jgi:DnaJ-class molecular chaperone